MLYVAIAILLAFAIALLESFIWAGDINLVEELVGPMLCLNHDEYQQYKRHSSSMTDVFIRVVYTTGRHRRKEETFFKASTYMTSDNCSKRLRETLIRRAAKQKGIVIRDIVDTATV